MFRRLFRGGQDDQPRTDDTAVEVPAEASDEQTPTPSDSAEPMPLETTAAVAKSAAPVAPQPETPVAATSTFTPLFRDTDEIERKLNLQPVVPERRSGLRRLFGGEERTAEEIQREERKTEQAIVKTRAGFFGRISELFNEDEPITDELWEQLEELLIMADVGVDTTVDLIERVQRKVTRENIQRASAARAILKQEMVKLLEPNTRAFSKRATKPYVILVIGVNGAGKTTLIAKVANRYKQEIGQSVLLAAADTFRAAAVEQLQTWAERVGVEVVAQGPGADPGAVAYDAVQRAYARDVDVLIIDTAGRLQSKFNLMQELQKIRNVVRKRMENGPHEVLLVIDATTGQNGVMQAKAFMEAAEVTHLAITKLDGTAKGGIAFAMVQQIQRPIKYIGTGEKVDDIAIFDPAAFVDALFDEEVPA
jgi:fused signal recognition particle receptor